MVSAAFCVEAGVSVFPTDAQGTGIFMQQMHANDHIK
jgi:hypothetical protein